MIHEAVAFEGGGRNSIRTSFRSFYVRLNPLILTYEVYWFVIVRVSAGLRSMHHPCDLDEPES